MATEQNAGASSTAPVRGGVVAYLTVDGASKAAKLYEKAFGAEVAYSIPADEKGRTMHIHLYINNGSLMLSDHFAEHFGPTPPKPDAFALHLQVDDVEAWWKRAVEGGLEVTMPLADMFWGDRYGQLRDPFGVVWTIGAPIKR
jgi:PhnB protein